MKGFLELPHGIPSDDTYRRVFAVLDAEQFQSRFMDWIEAVEELTEGQVVALDGKRLRRSHDRSEGKKALQMVSAWAAANGVVLGQRKVDGESNWEIENKPHWVLDIIFREDDCRIRKGNGAENLAVLRHIALNLLRRETSVKRSIKGQRMKAALDENYLLKALIG